MILGKTCTRGCAFCAVSRGDGEPIDSGEAARVSAAVEAMKLDYVVITSVTRDDLVDGGAQQFADTIDAVKGLRHNVSVEVLTPDYIGAPLRRVLDAAPTVFAHNIETVERLSAAMRHARFNYRRSLDTLRAAADFGIHVITKSSIMLGLGETRDDVRSSMRHLREVGVQILVLGQYLQPTKAHAPVKTFVSPSEFEAYAQLGADMGFEFVAAAPLARTSYRAAEAYVSSRHVK